MKKEEAFRILGAEPEDDDRTLKRKFRARMKEAHPDAVRSQKTEDGRRAQAINEAYALLLELRKKETANPKKTAPRKAYKTKKSKEKWTGEINQNAYAPRNIYIYHLLDVGQKINYHTVARDRYYWNPEKEDFRLFILSIRHQMIELLDGKSCEIDVQAKLFHYLAGQFVRPIHLLKQMRKPFNKDKDGREIYDFEAELKIAGDSRQKKRIRELREGAYLLPQSFEGNRLHVMDVLGNPLGYIAFTEDSLYYVLIPILQARKSQIRMTAAQIMKDYVKIDLQLRLDAGVQELQIKDLNPKIKNILEMI